MKAQDARFIGWVDEDGTMNYQTLFVPEGSTVDSPNAASPPADEPKSAKTEDPWTVMVEDIHLGNFTIDMEDRQPATPARVLVETLNFHTANVSSAMDQPLPISLSFQFNQTGKADLKGTVDIEPLSVEMKVGLTNIALKPFQPYIAPFVEFDVDSGALTRDRGKLHYPNRVTHQTPSHLWRGLVNLSAFQLVLH